VLNNVSLISALLLFSTTAIAQCCPGILLGHVTDAVGAAIPNAYVAVHCKTKDGNRDLNARTDAAGAYRTGQLTWEPCDVEISARGFVTEHRTIQPQIDTNIELNIQMHPAPATQPKQALR
jgi:hypothetical protein